MENSRQSKQPGDIVVLNGRTWRILGCYIGALGQEDVIGLEALDRRPPCAGAGKIYEMLVPEALVEGHVFRALPTSEEAGA